MAFAHSRMALSCLGSLFDAVAAEVAAAGRDPTRRALETNFESRVQTGDVVGAEVDLVVGAVDAESDGSAFSRIDRGAIDIVDERDLLSHFFLQCR